MTRLIAAAGLACMILAAVGSTSPVVAMIMLVAVCTLL